MDYQVEGYRISNKLNDFDLDVIHDFIASSYWAKGMPKDLLASAIANSLCFAILDSGDQQVAFARVITDKATFAYLADVFVLAEHRGLGLSKWMVNQIIAHPDLQGLRRMLLATADAHKLYEQFGFEAIQQPELFMEIAPPSIYTE